MLMMECARDADMRARRTHCGVRAVRASARQKYAGEWQR
jgi:hypothetical protein